MIDLSTVPDEAVLTTEEVAAWLECSTKTVLRMGLQPTPLRHRQYCYLASEIKRYLRGDRPRAATVRLRST